MMGSSDVGSYELKRSSCEMQMEECSANLARSTSDGSADNDNTITITIIIVILLLIIIIIIITITIVIASLPARAPALVPAILIRLT